MMLVVDQRIRLNLYQHAGTYQSGYLNHGCRWRNLAKRFLVGPGDLLPLINVGNKHSRAYNMLKTGTRFTERRSDNLDATTRLQIRVTRAHQITVLIYGRTAGDGNMWPDTNSTAITDERLPGCARMD